MAWSPVYHVWRIPHILEKTGLQHFGAAINNSLAFQGYPISVRHAARFFSKMQQRAYVAAAPCKQNGRIPLPRSDHLDCPAFNG